jgi:hypothetical protein
MKPIKKMIIEETVNALREVKQKKKINNLRKDLHEAVNTSGVLKSNSKKKMVAKKLVRIAESRLFDYRNKLKESHNQFEDETEMAKAQLLAIMEKSNQLYKMMNREMQLEDWVQYKLSIAENYIDAVHGYIKYFIGGQDMDDNMEYEMEDETEDQMDDQEWDDVEEEEFDDEDDEDYYDDESYDDFDDFDDFDEFDEEGGEEDDEDEIEMI